ncbi:phage head closure protein [Thermoactinomyces sp. FSL K6-2592]|jgi:SPP1 family predicted phage head-tail adaptor|uniref:phage head closure protein n=1 Tax=Thermoactinomyces sp. FSL K6-2592 TaxID=2975347 RepID=UPI0030FB5B57
MNAGRLKHRVTLQEEVKTPDGGGGSVVTWQDVATVWASVEPLKGRELYAAQQVRATLTHKIIIRYRPDISVNVKMRAVYNNRIFNITSVINEQESNKTLQLLAEEFI